MQPDAERVPGQGGHVKVQGGFPANELDDFHADSDGLVHEAAPVVGRHRAASAARPAVRVAMGTFELAELGDFEFEERRDRGVVWGLAAIAGVSSVAMADIFFSSDC